MTPHLVQPGANRVSCLLQSTWSVQAQQGSAGNRAGQSGWTRTDLPTELGPAAATEASGERRGNAAWPGNSTAWDWALPSEPTGKGIDPAPVCHQDRETGQPQAPLQIPPHQQRKYQPALQTHPTLCESRLWLGKEKKSKAVLKTRELPQLCQE